MSVETVPPLPMDEESVEAILQIAEAVGEEANWFGNPPFGAILATINDRDGLEFGASARNEVNTSGLSSNHAEFLAVRRLEARIGMGRLGSYGLFSPVESCPGCASFAIKAGVRRFYFGARAEETAEPYVPIEDIVRTVRPRPYIYFSCESEAAIRHEQVRRARLGGGTNPLNGAPISPQMLEMILRPNYQTKRVLVKSRQSRNQT